MRIFVVKQDTDLQALKAAVATPGLAEKLARLNPHLDVQKLVPGAVLLLPDDAAGRFRGPAGSTSIAGNTLSSFNDFAAEALEAASRGVKAGAQRQAADVETLKASLRTRTVKEALARDEELARQAEVALNSASKAAKAAETDARQFEANTAAARAALASLAKQFG